MYYGRKYPSYLQKCQNGNFQNDPINGNSKTLLYVIVCERYSLSHYFRALISIANSFLM